MYVLAALNEFSRLYLQILCVEAVNLRGSKGVCKRVVGRNGAGSKDI
jgi:ABC-type branched-subunit amino acid transport system ATPase component